MDLVLGFTLKPEFHFEIAVCVTILVVSPRSLVVRGIHGTKPPHSI